MKKKFLFVSLLMVLVLMLVGCGTNNFKVEVYNSDNEMIYSTNVKLVEDFDLVKALQDHKKIKLQGSTSEWGFFVTGVCDVEADAEHYWGLKVNGEDSMVGIGEVEVKKDDVIAFVLTFMEPWVG